MQDRRLELFLFFELGVEGIFVENMAEAITLRQEFAIQQKFILPDLSLNRSSHQVGPPV